MLNDEAIKEEMKRGSIAIERADADIKQNYVAVTLADTLKVYSAPALDVTKATEATVINIPPEGLVLKPGELYIGATNEFTKTYGFVPMLEGLDELAALGVKAHITAGFGDNGFEGTWTLEIICSMPTIVYPGMLIGYTSYYPVVGDSDVLYRGKYFGQVDPTMSRLSDEYAPVRKREK